MDAPARPDATAPAAEEQLTALREEIRHAGRMTVLFRLACVLGIIVPGVHITYLGVMFAFGSVLGSANWRQPSVAEILGVAATTMLPAALAAIGAGAGAAAGYRRRRKDAFRQRLEALPQPRQVELLRTMGRDRLSDTRKIIGALTRELNLPTELTPAATPEGSGTEVSGTGRPEPADRGAIRA